MKFKTWNEFWGEFLQITFHHGHPDLWPARERKAHWFIKHTGLNPGASVLDLGCGDGMIDVWLSRMGMQVTAVDRTTNVIEKAKQIDDTRKVNFISADLTKISFNPFSFDAVLFTEATGLINRNEEAKLIKKVYSWLKPNGKFVLDCPEIAELKNTWSKNFPDGVVRADSSFDEATRIQNIQFYFTPKGGEEFGIYDPYDLEMADAPGIIRYLYPRSEINSLLLDAGFTTVEIGHYYEKNYFGILAVK